MAELETRAAPGGGRPIEPVGRAERAVLDDRAELWVFAAADAALVQRLLALGARGLGGFESGGLDEAGRPWLVRGAAATTADGIAQGARMAWRDVLGHVATYSRALAA